MKITIENAIAWFNEQPKENQHNLYSEFETAFPEQSVILYANQPDFADWLLLRFAPIIAGELESTTLEAKQFAAWFFIGVALLAGLFSSCSNRPDSVIYPGTNIYVVLDEQITANEHGKPQAHYARILGDTTNALHIVSAHDLFGEGDTVMATIIQ